MIGGTIGAVVGERIARRHGSEVKGALIGAAVPVLARRLLGPLGLALAGGYVAKKHYDRRKQVRAGSA